MVKLTGSFDCLTLKCDSRCLQLPWKTSLYVAEDCRTRTSHTFFVDWQIQFGRSCPVRKIVAKKVDVITLKKILALRRTQVLRQIISRGIIKVPNSLNHLPNRVTYRMGYYTTLQDRIDVSQVLVIVGNPIVLHLFISTIVHNITYLNNLISA